MRSLTLFKAILLANIVALSACETLTTAERTVPPKSGKVSEKLSKHKTIAILPFDIVIYEKSKLNKNPTPEVSAVVQKQLYSEFSNPQKNLEYTVSFQSIEETNDLLRRANMNGDNIRNFTKGEIGAALGVDVFLSGDINYSKPEKFNRSLSGAVIDMGLGRGRAVTVNMTIHETKTGDLIWAFSRDQYRLSGQTLGHDAKSLAKTTAKRLPYIKKSNPDPIGR